jgi:hypothetical protein
VSGSGSPAMDAAPPATRVQAASLHAPPVWVLLGLPTLLLALWIMVGWKFSGLYGQDPYAYFSYSVGPLRNFFLRGTPPGPMFWPLGYPFPVALVSLLVGPAPSAGQAVSLLAGLASVLLTFLLGRDMLIHAGADRDLARRTGAIAALLAGVTGWLIQSSVVVMPDSLALATSLLAVWAIIRWLQVASLALERKYAGISWLAVAGAALAWSIVTRWGQMALLPVLVLAVLPAAWQRPSRLFRALPFALVAAGIVLGFQIWLMLTVDPGAAGGSRPFAGDFGYPGSQWSWQHWFMREFHSPDGVQRYSLPNGLYYATAAFGWMYLTPLLAPAVTGGLVVVFRRFHRAILLLVVWPALLLLVDAGLPHQNPRYLVAVLPPVAILAGLGMAAAIKAFRVPEWPYGWAATAASLILVAAAGLHGVRWLVSQEQAAVEVAHWTAARVPPRATVLSFDITLTLDHATSLKPRDLDLVSRRALQGLLAEHRPVYVLVQVGQMQGQWAQRPPGENYRLLVARPGLEPIGRLHGYTLYRVRQP